MVISVSTDDVDEHAQFEFWCEHAIQQHFVRLDAARNDRSPRGYNARMHAISFGGWAVHDVDADPMRVNRTMKAVRQNPASFLQISVLCSGRSLVMQDGRVAVQSEPNDIVIVDPLAPYIFEFERHSRQVQIQVPRELALATIPDVGVLTAVTIPGRSGLGQLAAHMMRSFNDYRDDRSDALSFSMTGSALELLAALAAEALGADASQPSAETLLARARQYLVRHLGDADKVMPAQVAEAISVSERYLYKLFERDSTTPHRWLRETRLTQAHRMLEQSSAMSIEAIGRSVGFASAAHFSRAFSAQFGVAPRDARLAAKARANG